MEWSSSTVDNLKELFKDGDYRVWAKAVEKGQLERFSPELRSLVDNLSKLLISELECSVSERNKIAKIMELAALAGKVL